MKKIKNASDFLRGVLDLPSSRAESFRLCTADQLLLRPRKAYMAMKKLGFDFDMQYPELMRSLRGHPGFVNHTVTMSRVSKPFYNGPNEYGHVTCWGFLLEEARRRDDADHRSKWNAYPKRVETPRRDIQQINDGSQLDAVMAEMKAFNSTIIRIEMLLRKMNMTLHQIEAREWQGRKEEE